jgi:hypothetical protein
MGNHKQEGDYMGKKKDEIPKVQIVSTKTPPGMDLDASGIGRGFVVGFLLLVVFLGWVMWQEFGDHSPRYHAPRPTSPVLTTVAIIIGVLLAVALLVGLVAAVVHLYVVYRKGITEVTQAEREAELIRAEENGVFPWRRAPDGTLQNLNAVPGPRIEANGEMRDPETQAQREAVQRAAVLQIVAGGHGRLSMADFTALAAPREMPPVQMIEGDQLDDVEHRLLEAGREEG